MKLEDPEVLTRLIRERLPDDFGEWVTLIGADSVRLHLPWRDEFAGAGTARGSRTHRAAPSERPVAAGRSGLGLQTPTPAR